ncbi:MAG: undecaprenyl-phosphate glucose phosphotransferase [Candidatus Tectomicrobia bacterium]|nr:undecaprenyl-phosphate glucose phosphotransferase [Candidatus Tectomicrobia bacterium]
MKKYAHLAVSVLVLADLLAATAAWSTAFFLRFHVEIIPVIKTYPTFLHYLSFVPVVLLFWLAAARSLGHYRPEEFSRTLRRRALEAWKAATLSLVLLTALTFFYREFPFARFSRVVMAYYWVLVAAYVVVGRSLARRLLKDLRKRGFEVRRILIAGTGELGRDLSRRMRANEVLGIEVAGYLTDRKEEAGAKIEGVPVAGTLEDVREVIASLKADQLFIALPLEAQDRLQRVLEGIGEEIIDIKVVPDFLRFMKLNAGIEDFGGLPVISLRESPLFGVNRLVKRTADVVISLVVLLVLSPLMSLIALAVKLTSPGPVFYRQERMGLDGVPFQMFKFRSMREGAEDGTGAVWASPEDPRRTPVGSILRKASLDELPQLFNVLKGDMSLVGPRPERPVFVEEFRRKIPGYMLRHKVKAGITGWAQVNGWRGNTPLEKRIECDLYYIENWSLGFDLKILWLTLWKGIGHRHAY